MSSTGCSVLFRVARTTHKTRPLTNIQFLFFRLSQFETFPTQYFTFTEGSRQVRYLRLPGSRINNLSVLPFSSCAHIVSAHPYTEHNALFCSSLCRSCADLQSIVSWDRSPGLVCVFWIAQKYKRDSKRLKQSVCVMPCRKKFMCHNKLPGFITNATV